MIAITLGARCSTLSPAHLAVRGVPGSDSAAKLPAWAGIGADHIAAATLRVIT
jgi:transketolase